MRSTQIRVIPLMGILGLVICLLMTGLVSGQSLLYESKFTDESALRDWNLHPDIFSPAGTFEVADGEFRQLNVGGEFQAVLNDHAVSDFVYEIEFQVTARDSQFWTNLRPVFRWKNGSNYLALSLQAEKPEEPKCILIRRTAGGWKQQGSVLIPGALRDTEKHRMVIKGEGNIIIVKIDDWDEFQLTVQDDDAPTSGKVGVLSARVAYKIHSLRLTEL